MSKCQMKNTAHAFEFYIISKWHTTEQPRTKEIKIRHINSFLLYVEMEALR